MVELSLLIVNYNSWRLCVEALQSFAEHPPRRADGSAMSWEAIVVDNASPMRDPEGEAEVARLCEATGGRLVRHDENSGYSKGMNLALSHARGEWLLVSNPDVAFLANTVDPLLRAMERDPRIGTAMPCGFLDKSRKTRLPPNILPTLRDLLGVTLADVWPGWCRRYSRKRTREAVRVWGAGEQDVDIAMLSGACFVVRRSDLGAFGGFFDERFPLYYEDTDLSMRILRAGRRIVQVGGAELVHFYDRSGQTNHEEKMRRYWASRRLYYEKWYGRLGAWIYDLTRKLLESKWGDQRKQLNPHPDFHDLGQSHGKPVIRLEKPRQRFLVEMALDPKFFLAAGLFGSGAEWSPPDETMASFGPTTYWFRVVDLDDVRQPVLGIYRYALLYPMVTMPQGPEADAAGLRRRADLAARERRRNGGADAG